MFKMLMNRRGCFGGSKKTSSPAVENPAPTPSPTPTVTGTIATSAERAKILQSYQYGLASTIRTSAQGFTGKGAELKAPGITGVNTTGGSAGVI